MKVVYIAGLYHSGSTLLDKLLGNFDSTIGLGEIFKAIQDGHESYCSCGENITSCSFWGDLSIDSSDLEGSYKTVFSRFKDHFPNSVLVDSSKCHPIPFKYDDPKRFKGLDFWIKSEHVELYVIHLYRDPRSWVSGLDRRDNLKKKNGYHSLAKRLYFSKFIRYLQWGYFHNVIRNKIRSQNLNHINISYEELVFNTQNVLLDVAHFIGQDFVSDFDLLNSKSHISVGNPWRNDKSANRKIRYDFRWLKEDFTLTDYIFSVFYRRDLKKYVYGKL